MSWICTKTLVNGKVFASKLEAALFQQFLLRERNAEISGIYLQPKVYLTAARLLYTVDFLFWDIRLGIGVWAEAKGRVGRDWAIKKRLWKAGYGPGRLEIYTGSHLRLEGPEVIIPELLGDIR